MEQNTEAWHAWRGKGIGSSDAPIILGMSPYSTPLQLWEHKTGLVPKAFQGNFATERGHALESVAREHYALRTGLKPEPCNVEHSKHPFLRASLDGLDKPSNIVLEIKCPGKEDHERAAKGELPEKYVAQVQHQLNVAGAELAHYWSFAGKEDGSFDGILVEVRRNEKFIAALEQAEIEFWQMVLEKNPPPLTDRDVKKVKDEKLIYLIDQWREVTNAMKLQEVSQENLRGLIEERMKAVGHPRIECNGLRVTNYWRKGNVDYKKIPQLKGLNLDAYRKGGSMVTTFKDQNDKDSVSENSD